MGLPAAEREPFVRREAGHDPALADEVLALCRAAEVPVSDALHRAAQIGSLAGPTPPAPDEAEVGVRSTATDELLRRLDKAPRLDTDRYHLEGQVGRGGVGVVLRLHDRHLHRRLAMKVLREREVFESEDRQVSRQLLGRFLEEAQVTSQLDHPGVVPVHELGLDPDGKVYFTMRLVRGQTAGAVFASARAGQDGWTTTRALEVVLKVCDTIAFAHDRGVMHRDLKPANVMVGKFGEVYVMDWGLAKLFGAAAGSAAAASDAEEPLATARRRDAGNDGDADMATLPGQKLGTPEYMAPEQAAGTALDERVDVYAIGAMLYELLTGRPPYGAAPGQARDVGEILRHVRDGLPMRIEQVQPGVPAELVAITERAMARDREERYPKVVDLSADLRAFLDQRAVQAYRTGALVELKLWVRRNKALAVSLAAAALLLVVGSLGIAVYSEEAKRNERQAKAQEILANQRAAETRLAADFNSRTLSTLSVELFGDRLLHLFREEVASSRHRAGGTDAEASAAVSSFDELSRAVNMTNVARQALREVLFEPAAATIARDYGAQPLVAAMLRSPLAETLANLGLTDLGLEVAHSALATWCEMLPPDHPNVAVDTLLVARLERDAGHFEAAEQAFRDCERLNRATYGEASPQAIGATNGLGDMLRQAGRAAEAEQLLTANLEVARASLGADHLDTLACANNLAQAILARGDAGRAVQLMRGVLASVSSSDATARPRLAVLHNLATALRRSNQWDAALEIGLESLKEHARIHGHEHPDTLDAADLLALIQADLGQFDAAKAQLQRVLAVSRRVRGNQHPRTLSIMNNLGMVLRNNGHPDAAEPLLRECLVGRLSLLPRDHAHTLGTKNLLALALRDLQRFDEAESLYREVLAAQRRSLPQDSSETTRTMNNLGRLLTVRGKRTEARKLLTEAVARQRESAGIENRQTLIYIDNLAHLLIDLGEYGEGERLLGEALDVRRRTYGIADRDTLKGLRSLAALMASQDRFEEAARLLEDAWTSCERALGSDDRETLLSALQLAHLERRARKPGAAEAIYRRLLPHCEAFGGTPPLVLYCKSGLGWSLLDAGQAATAVPWFDSVLELSPLPDDVFEAATSGLVAALEAMQATDPSDDRAARLDEVRRLRAARHGGQVEAATRK